MILNNHKDADVYKHQYMSAITLVGCPDAMTSGDLIEGGFQ